MIEETAKTISDEPTDVRYGTRSLLIAMAVVAVSLTGLGAFLRLFSSDVQPRLVVHWCIFFAMLVAFVAYAAWRRYGAEKNAGAVRFLLPTHSYFLSRVPAFARVLYGTFLLLVGPVLWTVASYQVAQSPWAIWMQLINWQTYIAVFVSSLGIAYLWWHRSVRICDQGLVVRYKLFAWSSIRRWYWDACYSDVIVFEFNQNERVAVKVPAGEREVVEGLVKERVAR